VLYWKLKQYQTHHFICILLFTVIIDQFYFISFSSFLFYSIHSLLFYPISTISIFFFNLLQIFSISISWTYYLFLQLLSHSYSSQSGLLSSIANSNPSFISKSSCLSQSALILHIQQCLMDLLFLWILLSLWKLMYCFCFNREALQVLDGSQLGWLKNEG
jgi:hypothetical protein